MSKLLKINKPQLSAIAIAMTLALSGCGGGGVDSLAPQPDLGFITSGGSGNGGSSGGNSSTALMNISDTLGLEDNSGPTNVITNNGATATIMVLDADGMPLKGVKVVFKGEGLKYIDSDDGSTLTDASGKATMGVKPAVGSKKSTSELTATVTNSKGQSATTEAYFYTLDPTGTDGGSTPIGPFNISNTIGLEYSNGSPTRNIGGSGAIAKVKITNEKGAGIEGVKVVFNGEGLEYYHITNGSLLSDGSAVTGADGWARIKVVPIKGDKGGTGELKATATSDEGEIAETKKSYAYTYNPDPIPTDCSANTADKHVAGCPVISKPGDPTDPNAPIPIDLTNAIIYIESSSPTLKTGSDRIDLTIRVTDKFGGIIPGVPVQLQIDQPKKYGLSFESSSSMMTDSKGLITVGLKQQNTNVNAQINHPATITVKIKGKADSKITLDVLGTRVHSVLTAFSPDKTSNKFSIEGLLVDGSDVSIANTKVALINEGKTVKTVATDVNGQFNFSEVSPNNLTSKNDLYTFDLAILNSSGNTLQTMKNISEIAATSSSIAINSNDIVVDEKGTVVVTAANAEGKTVNLATNKGKFSNGKSFAEQTITNGKATFKLEASVSGVATLEASIDFGGTKGIKTNSTTLNFVSVNAKKLSAQVKRSELSVNSSTELLVTVLDDTNTPVKYAKVDFVIDKDSSGGSLSKVSMITDEFGKATVTYTSGSNPTASKGVKIKAIVRNVIVPKLGDTPGKTYDVKAPNGDDYLADTVNLTVQTSSSSLAFGVSDKIILGPRNVYYTRYASVFVTNNAGQPAANQPVSIALRPREYRKGFFYIPDIDSSTWVGYKKDWRIGYKTAPENATFDDNNDPNDYGDWRWHFNDESHINNPDSCISEDATFAADINDNRNYNSFLDSGEDYNGNGSLESGYDATILVDGTTLNSTNGVYNLTTDKDGKADFEIRHLKSYSNWFTMNLEATTKVDGSESSQKRPIEFPAADKDIKLSKQIRPNTYSPYGLAGSCKNPN